MGEASETRRPRTVSTNDRCQQRYIELELERGMPGQHRCTHVGHTF